MAEETSPAEARAKVWDLLEKFQAAMLVTQPPGGHFSARPMSHIVRANEGRVYILTERATQSAKDIAAHPAALLTLADGKRYVSLNVHGEVSTDRALIEDLWNPGAQAFWPEGASSTKVCALVLRPHSGEYWDGDNTLLAGIKLALANLTGSPPDFGDHGTARL
jgi:general stress protein 26